MVWTEQKDNLIDCYFCLTNVLDSNIKSKHTIQYPNFPSAIRCVLHSEDLPVASPPKMWILDDENERGVNCNDLLM
jgi:hypothetical protein